MIPSGVARFRTRMSSTTEYGTLVNRGQEARRVRLRSGFRRSVGHHDEGRQVLALRSKPVNDPRSETRLTGKLRACVAQINRRSMIERVPVAGTDQRDLVGLRPDVREQFRDLHARLAIVVKLPRAASHRSLREVDAIRLQPFRRFGRDGLAATFRQLGFRIERIDMADTAVHEQVDDALRFRRLMRSLRRERVLPVPPATSRQAQPTRSLGRPASEDLVWK